MVTTVANDEEITLETDGSTAPIVPGKVLVAYEDITEETGTSELKVTDSVDEVTWTSLETNVDEL